MERLSKTHKWKKAIALSIVALFLFNISIPIASAQEPSEQNQPFTKWLKDRLQVNASVYEEFDDNVFLSQNEQRHDWKTSTNASFNFLNSWDKGFFNLVIAPETTYFARHERLGLSNVLNARASYEITPNFSLGFQEVYLYSRNVDKTIADEQKFLRLGYHINNFQTNASYAFSTKSRLRLFSGWIFTNFLNTRIDDSIDKYEINGGGSYEYDFNYLLTGYYGYVFRHNNYKHSVVDVKDFDEHLPFAGLIYRWPRILKANLKLGWQWRDFDKSPNDSNLNISFGVASIFSRFTTISAVISHGLGDSTRSDFKQYIATNFSAGISHRFAEVWTISTSAGISRRYYHDSDRFTNALSSMDRESYSYSLNASLRRKLNKTFYLEGGYYYAKQDTDFAQEGYTNNRYQLKLTGYW